MYHSRRLTTSFEGFAALASFVGLLGLGGCGSGPVDTDAGGEICEPTCRGGFVCLRGECVSSCNPVCGAGERCTVSGECVADMDGGPDGGGPDGGDMDGGDMDGGDMDGGDMDAGRPDAAPTDASTDSAVTPPRSCPPGEVLCGATCRAPTLPDVGVRTPTSGRWRNDWFDSGDIAVDPCTGNVGLAFAQQISGGDNWEIYVMVVPATLGAPATAPVRVTTAPGAAQSVAVAWAGDRFAVFWSDPRHDLAPETCPTRCLRELYFAAFDSTTGAVTVPERRLTTNASDYQVGSTRAVWGPGAGEVGVAWTDSRGSRQVHAAIVSPAGVMRAEQVVSAAVAPLSGNTPRIVWNDDAWQLLYRHDEPSGSRPDYLHTRALDVSGTLGSDIDLRVPAEQIGLAARGTLGYATITTGGSALALRLWDLGWTAGTTLPNTTATFDGSRPIIWDGESLYLTSTTSIVEVVRYNALGTETGRILLTSTPLERATRNVRMHRVGTRLILMWNWSTGGLSPVAHHQVQVVETTSAL